MAFYIRHYIMLYIKGNYIVIGLEICNLRHKNEGFGVDTEVI